MAFEIKKYHGSYNKSKRTASIQYIICHYVGGGTSKPGNAKNNCIYFSGGNRGASADYFIDDADIYEYNDPAEGYYTWHVGDGKGRYGITNNNAIGIEVCNNGGAYTEAEIERLAWLVQHLMAKFGVKTENVRMHWHASRKQCPLYYSQVQTEWAKLHARITNGAKWVKNDTGWWYRYTDGSWPHSQWLELDAWYYFDKEGWALQDKWFKDGQYWYYLAPDCRMATGWTKLGSDWFYLRKEADPGSTGSMFKGWLKDKGIWYFMNRACDGTEGAMHVGWLELDGYKYYFKKDGAMACNETLTIGKKKYTFNKDGALA